MSIQREERYLSPRMKAVDFFEFMIEMTVEIEEDNETKTVKAMKQAAEDLRAIERGDFIHISDLKKIINDKRYPKPQHGPFAAKELYYNMALTDLVAVLEKGRSDLCH